MIPTSNRPTPKNLSPSIPLIPNSNCPISQPHSLTPQKSPTCHSQNFSKSHLTPFEIL